MNRNKKGSGSGGKNTLRERHLATFKSPNADQMYTARLPFTPRFNTMLSFNRAFQLTTAATVNVGGSEQIFSPSNLYQPDFTGNNHQPYGYDQLTPLYAKWIVHWCHITMTISTSAASKPVAIVWSIQPYNATYSLAAADTVDKAMEKPMNGGILLDTTGKQSTKQLNLNIARIEGLTNTQYNSEIDLYSGAAAGPPTRAPYFRMALFNLLDNTQPTAQVMVRMVFNATFFDRNILASS